MKKLVLALLTLSFFQAQAQKAASNDYLVTTRLDTLRGEVKIFTYDIIDRTEVTGATGKKHFTANQIREIHIGKEIYNPVKTEGGIIFMKLVKPGFLSLYMGHPPKTYNFDIPYLVKRSGETIEVPNLSFKKMMSSFLEECKPLSEQVAKGKYGRKDLDTIIYQFNQCTSSPPVAVITAAPVEVVPDSTLTPFIELKDKLEKDTSLPNQKDALDILKDITEKVRSKQAVPNYLLDGLKSQLKDAPSYQQDLEKVIAAVKPQ